MQTMEVEKEEKVMEKDTELEERCLVMMMNGISFLSDIIDDGAVVWSKVIGSNPSDTGVGCQVPSLP